MPLMTLYLLLTAGLLLGTVASLFWTFRPYKLVERHQLRVIFISAGICVLLQFISQLFLCIALVLLMGGLFIALRLERVRIVTGP